MVHFNLKGARRWGEVKKTKQKLIFIQNLIICTKDIAHLKLEIQIGEYI